MIKAIIINAGTSLTERSSDLLINLLKIIAAIPLTHFRHTGSRAAAIRYPRLHGCRRYDYMEVIGRVESGTETESNSGRLQGRNR